MPKPFFYSKLESNTNRPLWEIAENGSLYKKVVMVHFRTETGFDMIRVATDEDIERFPEAYLEFQAKEAESDAQTRAIRDAVKPLDYAKLAQQRRDEAMPVLKPIDVNNQR